MSSGAGTSTTPRLRCQVLGGLGVSFDGDVLPLGGAKQQMVLARLLLDANRPVPAERIVEWVWGESAGESSAATLQVYVSNLRRALAPAADALGRQLIVTQRPGYLVAVEPDELDLSRFERSLAAADEAQRSGRPDERIARLRAALAEWRGDPLAGLPVEVDGLALTTRLTVQRDGAVESLLEAEVDAGRHREVLGELEEELARQPLNERLRELHMLALYRSGRQADALASYREARERFVDELGLDPSPRLAALEARILDHDPSLQLPEVSSRPGGALASDLDGPTVVRSSVLWIPARLVIDGRELVLDRGVVTIGRSAERDVVLEDPGVSRRHAEIRQEGQEWRIVDVGSANGVVVNGVRTGSATLADGDRVRLGGVELTFRVGA